jgi:hypothetical protein
MESHCTVGGDSVADGEDVAGKYCANYIANVRFIGVGDASHIVAIRTAIGDDQESAGAYALRLYTEERARVA